MVFSTPYRNRVITMESGGGASITEQAGYVPPKIQIEQMMFAGQKLQAFRAEMFDFAKGNDGDIDPTRHPGLDLAEATQLGRDLAIRMKERQKRKNAEKLAAEAIEKQEESVLVEGDKKALKAEK